MFRSLHKTGTASRRCMWCDAYVTVSPRQEDLAGLVTFASVKYSGVCSVLLQSSGICWTHGAADPAYDVSRAGRGASVNSASAMDIEATSHSINTWLESTSAAAAMSTVKSERCEVEVALYSRQDPPSVDQSPPRLLPTLDGGSLNGRRLGDVKDAQQATNGKLDLSAVLQTGRTSLEAAPGGTAAHQLLGSDDIEVFFSSLNSPAMAAATSSRVQPGTMSSLTSPLTSPLTTLTNARSAENGTTYNYYNALHQHAAAAPGVGVLAYSSASPYGDYGPHPGHIHDKALLNAPVACYGEAAPRSDGYGPPPRPGWTFPPYPSSLALPPLPQYPGEHERPSEGVAYVTSAMGRTPLNGYLAAPPGTGGIADHGVWGGMAGGLPDLDDGVIGPGE